MPIASSTEHPLREPILLGREPVVLSRRHLRPPSQRAGSRRRSPLVRRERELERIAADVVGLERHRRLEALMPVAERLARDAIDEVETDVVEPRRARRAEGRTHLVGRVAAGERPQIGVSQRLGAEADPGHSGMPQSGPVRRLARARVRLQGDLLERRRPIGRFAAAMTRPTCSALSSDGVPPPK